MQTPLTAPHATELKELVSEASQALTRLNADRLEELALSCQAFYRSLPAIPGDMSHATLQQQREMRRQMAAFRRVLEVTHGNLEVMRQIRNFEAGLLEYSAPSGLPTGAMENRNGND